MPTATLTGLPTFRSYTERDGAALRLYCFPPSGFGPGFFADWAGHLPSTVDLFAAYLPGRGSRRDEPAITDARALIKGIADALATDDRPFAFFGHSLGALVAFETARRLRRLGQRMPELLALSAFPAPHDGQLQGEVASWLLGGIERFSTLVGAPARRFAEDPDLLAATCRPLVADALLVLQYEHHEEAPLDTPLALYGGQSDPIAPAHRLAAWNDLVTLPATPHLFPGGHQYPRHAAAPVAARLLADLRAVTHVV